MAETTATDVTSAQTAPAASSPKHLLQIDLLKAAAIIAVIVMHGMTTQALEGGWGAFHVWQAVPIFIVLLGLNAASSAQRHGIKLASYYRSRARRLLPIWVAVVISVVGGVLTGRGEWMAINFAGWLPLRGPGNYFIVIVVEFVLLFPLMWAAYKRWPIATIVGLFAIELVFSLIIQASNVLEAAGTGHAWFLYTSEIPHWLSGIALGIWLAKDPDLFAKRNRWIVALAAVSIVYLLAFSATSSDFTILPDQQNLISFPYAALLIMLGIRYLPAAGGLVLRGLGVIGQASLHIFLVQMFWFGQSFYYVPTLSDRWEIQTIPNLIVCIVGGTVFWWIDVNLGAIWRFFTSGERRRLAPRPAAD
jgi:peptidoglycan/LPS O-acetylase OafA/YrhL